jgi:hypothetical protein
VSGQILGKVHFVGATESFGTKGFQKRTVVIEVENGRFSQFVPIDATGDRTYDLDEIRLGDEVEVHYKLGGRKWQKDPNSEVKYFLSAELIRISTIDGNESYDDSIIADEDQPF